MSDELKEVTNPQTPADEITSAEEKPKSKKKADADSTAVLEEVVIKLEDLQEENEYPQEEMEFLTNMYDRTMNAITEGEIVEGRILDITDSDVIIDIGFKSEGIVPLDEFVNLEDLKPGDAVEVFLETLESSDGQLVLSRKRADFLRVWERVVRMHEDDEIVPGTITRRIKGGMVVNLLGIDAFLPGSQIDVKPIRDFDSYLGRTMNYKIVKVNHARKNIVVSSRVLIEKEMESQRGEILKTLEKGQKRIGSVKNITDFGVFIDLGGVDGLLHITDLSWGRVNHPSELVKLDQQLEVMILDFNENKDRISLGLKQLQPHPWENVEKKYPVGSVIKGKVVSITDYGAFIELEKGIEGLIHISEMSWSQHIKHPSQLLSVGQEIEAVVLNIAATDKKISLGLKQLEPDPWEHVEGKYPVGTIHKGVVRNITQFGAFVELEEGIDGLVHISDLSWTKKVRHPSEIVKKADEIEVVVLGINREERRIALGHKQVDANPWDAFEENYSVETETTGKITRLIEKGAIITLPMGVDGFVPNQHMGLPKGKKASDVYNVGDDIPAKVIEFDKDNKKIVLSVNAYFKDKEREEWEKYLNSHGISKTTLEDIAKTDGTDLADIADDSETETPKTSETKTEEVSESADDQESEETKEDK
ncbi:MAG: 30S ribosomal protein S1 [Calditrichaceae bacterium]